MKGIMLGAFGVVGVGAVAVGGTGGPDDFIRTVNKPPEAVYAAFSNVAPEGVTEMASQGGWDARVKQTITKVPNEQLKYELTLDGESLVSAEVQLAPSEGGTQIAAELEFNKQRMNELLHEAGGTPIPTFAMEDFLLDQVFAQAMNEMANRIEEGKPLLSLAETHARWGSGNASGGTSRHVSPSSAGSAWKQRQATRPQLNARPQMDPNKAAQDVATDSSGWGR